jgi:soluble lytic murein transglycosylase-like protein
VEGNSIIPTKKTSYPERVVSLAYLSAPQPEIKDLIYHFTQKYNLDYKCFSRIVYCESSFNHEVCNLQYGCKSGQGLCGVIPSTEKRLEEILGREMDMLDPYDNLEVGAWLLANEGTRHWGDYTTNWGSWECWKAYCP